jgi:molybdate transport system ATP-binding protein
MQFQDYALLPHLSARDNLRFVRTHATKESERQIEALLERMDLAGLADRKPSRLSGGQQQRLALARCFVQPADLYLLDEPLSALDRNTRVALTDWLKEELQSHNACAIVVSHDLAEVFALADDVLLFEAQGVRLVPPRALLTAARSPGRFQLSGQILALEPHPLHVHVTLAIGQETLSTLVPHEAASTLRVGHYVSLRINGSSVVLDSLRTSPSG